MNNLIIISRAIFDDRNINKVEEYCNKNNDVLYVLPDVPWNNKEETIENIKKTYDNCVGIPLILCTLQWAKILINVQAINMGLIYSDKMYNISEYYPFFGEYLLNYNGCFMTYDMLLNNTEMIMKTFNDRDLFVKPNSGNKLFTGQIIRSDNHFEDLEKLFNLTSWDYNTLVFISNAKEIDEEYRFWIADGEIISATSYNWDNKQYKNIHSEIYNHVIDYIKNYKHINEFFVIDIARLKNKYSYANPHSYKVIEINAVSTSGIYNGDTEKIFDKMKDMNEKQLTDLPF